MNARVSTKIRVALSLTLGSIVLGGAFTNCGGSFMSSHGLSSQGDVSESGPGRNFQLASNEIEMILQPDFAGGVRVVPACQNAGTGDCDGNHDYRIVNPLNPTLAGSAAAWEFAQWDSTTNLPTTGVAQGDGSYAFADAQKGITFCPDGRTRFTTNGLARYNGAYRTQPQYWMGMIAQQPFSAPGGILMRSSGTLKQMQSMMFSVDVHLISDERNIRAGYDASIHAAQFPIFFTVQNLKIGHPDYGKMVWLGIPTYDDRTPFLDGMSMMDLGTASLMYSRPYRDFATKSVHSKEWVHLEADLLPMAKEAVAEAVKRGIFSSSDLDLYMIGGMNIGTEITGLNVLTMDVKNLSLRIVNPTLMGTAPVPTSALAPLAARTVRFETSGATYAQTYVAGEAAASSNALRIFNVTSGRSTDVRVNLDSSTHAILSVDPVGHPYFCYDQTQGPCTNVTVPAGYPYAGTQSQNCYSRVIMSGALSGNVGRTTADLACAAPVPDTPEGFWQVPNQDGVFYSNGKDAFCIFTDYQTYLRWHNGNPVVDGYRQIPKNMRNDGVCP